MVFIAILLRVLNSERRKHDFIKYTAKLLKYTAKLLFHQPPDYMVTTLLFKHSNVKDKTKSK